MIAPARLLWIPRDAQKVVPWQNGRGLTRQVAIEPADADLGTGFVWRVSLAGVATDGPFSRLPGVDRILWLLRGDGMELDLDGERVRLDQPLQRLDFAGERNVSARLLAGPTEDLNVMVTRSIARATAAMHVLPEGEAWRATMTPGQHLLLVVTGTAVVCGGVLGPGDAVRVDGAMASELLAADGQCTFLLATFTRHGPASRPGRG